MPNATAHRNCFLATQPNLSSRGRWVAWIAPPHVPYAPALRAAGIDLEVPFAPGRADATDAVVRSTPLTEPCRNGYDADLRWVLLHLINETARHAGHADATRELLDGTTGE